MKSYVKKTQDQQKTLASQEQNTQDNTFQLMSSQPNAQLHTQLQEQMNNSPQMLQMKAMQELASNNQQEQQVAQLQSAQGIIQRQEGTEQGGSEQQENKTGLPDDLKSGVEALSGLSMDDTKVHYNSDKPAQLQAHAYAQGNNIHLASGQEKHLPHEAWHVVQQKQGRVKPTTQLKGKVNINDDQGLEHEADVMGQKALQMQKTPYKKQGNNTTNELVQRVAVSNNIAQRVPVTIPDEKQQQGNLVAYGSKTGTLGGYMRNPAKGSVPSVEPKGWLWLRKKIGKLKGKWVRFHIINENLGGPGNTEENLVPTTVAVNNEFCRDFEAYAKENAKTKWTYIEVSFNYPNLDSDGKYIPQQIYAEWGTLIDGKWVQMGVKGLSNPSIADIDAGNEVYLSGSNITAAQVKARGVPQAFASDFVEWLKGYEQDDDDINTFEEKAEEEANKYGESIYGESGCWVDGIYLDESDTDAGVYVPVLKSMKIKK